MASVTCMPTEQQLCCAAALHNQRAPRRQRARVCNRRPRRSSARHCQAADALAHASLLVRRCLFCSYMRMCAPIATLCFAELLKGKSDRRPRMQTGLALCCGADHHAEPDARARRISAARRAACRRKHQRRVAGRTRRLLARMRCSSAARLGWCAFCHGTALHTCIMPAGRRLHHELVCIRRPGVSM